MRQLVTELFPNADREMLQGTAGTIFKSKEGRGERNSGSMELSERARSLNIQRVLTKQ